MGIEKFNHYLMSIDGPNTKPLYHLSPKMITKIKNEIKGAILFEQTITYYPSMLNLNILNYFHMKDAEGKLYDSTPSIVSTMSENPNILITLNCAILNILSTFRSYIDITAHLLSNQFGKDNIILKKFESKQTELFDGHFSYRFMCKYRNYVQHVGLPISDLAADNIDKLKGGKVKTSTLVEKELLLKYYGWGLVKKDLSEMSNRINIDDIIKGFGEVIKKLDEELLDTAIKSDLYDFSNILRHYNFAKTKNPEMAVSVLFNNSDKYTFQIFPEKTLELIMKRMI